jgi:drug/metabolite transporter (DMT)-like permease
MIMSKLTPGTILMLLVNVILGSTGQILLKYGTTKLHRLQSHQGFASSLLDSFKGIFTPYVFLGFCVYAISAVLWIRILRQVNLSFAYPTIAISYIIVTIGSILIFHEKVSTVMAFGLLLIAAGVIMYGIGYGIK